jgi:hypothetical protein
MTIIRKLWAFIGSKTAPAIALNEPELIRHLSSEGFTQACFRRSPQLPDVNSSFPHLNAIAIPSLIYLTDFFAPAPSLRVLQSKNLGTRPAEVIGDERYL